MDFSFYKIKSERIIALGAPEKYRVAPSDRTL